jgi:predicted TIM-barrel fold metal-dependent hydrolase
MIIDAHCHLVPTEAGLELTFQRMADAGVDHTVVVPGGMVPSLGLGDFLRGRAPLDELEPNNAFNLAAIRRFPQRISAFFHFDPSYDDLDDAADAIANGFSGFKLNPIVDRVDFNHPTIDELFDYAQQSGLPIYSHIVLTGGASIDSLATLLSRHPNSHVVLGHMGFASSDGEAIRLARRFDNMLLETSVGAFHAISEAYKLLGATKLVFGSEGPSHHPAVELYKIKLLDASPSDYDLICGGNICRYLNRGDRA